MTPNTQITQENVGLLKAGDWLRFNHTPEAYDGNGIVQVKSTGDFALCLVGDPWPDYNPARFTYIGPDLGDGWIGWLGGENPVPGMRVEIKARTSFWNDKGLSSDYCWQHVPHRDALRPAQDIIAFRPAPSPPAEVPFAAEDACLACNSPTPSPVDHIGDATEKVDWARCQRCGGEIQGWICQDCHQEFEENDASELVFCPSESVDWERVGPKLVEALDDLIGEVFDAICEDGEPKDCVAGEMAGLVERARQLAQQYPRAALAAAQPEGK